MKDFHFQSSAARSPIPSWDESDGKPDDACALIPPPIPSFSLWSKKNSPCLRHMLRVGFHFKCAFKESHSPSPDRDDSILRRSYDSDFIILMEKFTLSDPGLAFVRRRHRGRCLWNICHPDIKDPNTVLCSAELCRRSEVKGVQRLVTRPSSDCQFHRKSSAGPQLYGRKTSV